MPVETRDPDSRSIILRTNTSNRLELRNLIGYARDYSCTLIVQSGNFSAEKDLPHSTWKCNTGQKKKGALRALFVAFKRHELQEVWKKTDGGP